MSFATRKIFRNCQLKTIEMKGSGWYEAKLHCPRTEDDRVEVKTEGLNQTKNDAIRNLAKVAGGMVCASCPYAGKSEVEVTIYRTDLAKAEAERLHAYQTLDEARKEVEQLQRDYTKEI